MPTISQGGATWAGGANGRHGTSVSTTSSEKSARIWSSKRTSAAIPGWVRRRPLRRDSGVRKSDADWRGRPRLVGQAVARCAGPGSALRRPDDAQVTRILSDRCRILGVGHRRVLGDLCHLQCRGVQTAAGSGARPPHEHLGGGSSDGRGRQRPVLSRLSESARRTLVRGHRGCRFPIPGIRWSGR